MFEGVTLGERYQVYGQIGGSSLIVRYDGIDTLLARPVDIVALTPLAASEPDLRDQFQALGRTAASRSHPHIVDIYDLGTHNGQPFIVTEHTAGELLRAIIDDEAPFHPDDTIALIQQLAPAADNEVTRAAGGAMVSVDTVVVDAAGVAKHSDVLTFGARHVAAADPWGGRPDAPSPHPAPVPAIATIAYELLTARAPDAGPRSMPPSAINGAVTPDMDRIVLRALDPRLRDYPSAGSFAAALTAAARRARDIRAAAMPPTQPLPRPALSSPPRLVEPHAERTSIPPAEPAMPPKLIAPHDDEFDDDDFSLRQPMRRVPWTWLTIAVLIALVIVLAVARFRTPDSSGPQQGNQPTQENAQGGIPSTVNMGAPTQAATDTVPDIVGATRDAAAAEISRRGLVLVEDQPVFSDSIPAGSVATQNPVAGAGVPNDRTVHVSLSRGPSSIDLASLGLVGKAESDASRDLIAKGFSVQSRQETSSSIAAGVVVAVEPNGYAKPGTAVTLVVSVGDKAQISRDIFSMPLQDAEADLTHAGFKVAGTIKVGPSAIQGKIDTAHYQIVSGDVIGVQNATGDAAFGAWVARGSAVTLVYYDAST